MKQFGHWRVLYYSPIATSISPGDFSSTLRQGPFYFRDSETHTKMKMKESKLLEAVRKSKVQFLSIPLPILVVNNCKPNWINHSWQSRHFLCVGNRNHNMKWLKGEVHICFKFLAAACRVRNVALTTFLQDPLSALTALEAILGTINRETSSTAGIMESYRQKSDKRWDSWWLVKLSTVVILPQWRWLWSQPSRCRCLSTWQCSSSWYPGRNHPSGIQIKRIPSYKSPAGYNVLLLSLWSHKCMSCLNKTVKNLKMASGNQGWGGYQSHWRAKYGSARE